MRDEGRENGRLRCGREREGELYKGRGRYEEKMGVGRDTEREGNGETRVGDARREDGRLRGRGREREREGNCTKKKRIRRENRVRQG